MKKKPKKNQWPITMTKGFKQHLEALDRLVSVPFINSKGDRIHIPKHYTIDDLLRMGVKEIRMERKGSFLPDGWYRNEIKKTFSPEQKETTKRKDK